MTHLFFTRLFARSLLSGLVAISLLVPSITFADANVTGEEIVILSDDTVKLPAIDLSDSDFAGETAVGAESGGAKLPNQSSDVNINDGGNADAQSNVIRVGNDDLWQRIKNGYVMPNSTSSLVAKHEEFYSSRPDYVRRMVERSQKYLFHVVEQLEKRGMPTELALLPMVESAYNPQAYSTSRASGIWQFIPSTGKNFGLKQNWWVDNRRNITIATDAALTYLQKLYGMFGSWDLALAAYNAGEGTVSRAIERNRNSGLATNYESLNLPPETRNYVPKLQAIKNLMTNPGKYGLQIQTIANTPYFAKVTAPAQIDAQLAAKLAEISDDEFLALNPSYNRPVATTSAGEVHELLLPITAAQTFRNNLARYDKPLVSWQTYYAKRGERMDGIASKFGIHVTQLRQANNLPAYERIANSATILVPIGNSASNNLVDVTSSLSSKQSAANIDLSSAENNALNHAAEKADVPKPKKMEPAKPTSISHTVKKNETLQAIAKQYGVSVKQIMSANALKNKRVKVGQSLTITTNAEDDEDSKSAVKPSKRGSTRAGSHTKAAHMAQSKPKRGSSKTQSVVTHKKHRK